ncbi:hypothetical protein K457DRAFT_870119 [Linnemannia elongata AG-77]|uniref:Uncharacterized protein n=1 Tax=Linnemannia elongata AG-77 TaxID=1314771 RepID=A0A197JG37_9FUNG|nr:hypothetical protein K457DRAFT_870119 [Linnemannia elongata AG-77]
MDRRLVFHYSLGQPTDRLSFLSLSFPPFFPSLPSFTHTLPALPPCAVPFSFPPLSLFTPHPTTLAFLPPFDRPINSFTERHSPLLLFSSLFSLLILSFPRFTTTITTATKYTQKTSQAIFKISHGGCQIV